MAVSSLNLSGRKLGTLNISGRVLGTLNISGRSLAGTLGLSGRVIVDTSTIDTVQISPATVSVVGQVLTIESKDTVQISPATVVVTGETLSIVEGVASNDEVGFNFENSISSDKGKAITLSNPGALGYDTGISGNALDFDGTDKLESTDDLFINVGDEDFEMMLWVKLQATGQNHGLSGQTQSQYHLHIVSGGTVRWRVNGTNCASGAGAIDDTTTWHHVRARYEAATDTATLVIDEGTPITLGSVSAPTPATNTFTIGSIGSGNEANALIDSYKWKRGLFSAGEISAHWNGGSGADV